MATITIKKKKPMSLQGGADVEAEETVATMTAPKRAGATVSGGKGPSYAIEATCAILTVICFAVLLMLQWTELQDYGKPPAAFVTPGVPLAS